MSTPIKPFHFEPQSEYALVVLFESWLHLTALLDASMSILEGAGLEVAPVNAAIKRGDQALLTVLRRDRACERMY